MYIALADKIVSSFLSFTWQGKRIRALVWWSLLSARPTSWLLATIRMGQAQWSRINNPIRKFISNQKVGHNIWIFRYSEKVTKIWKKNWIFFFQILWPSHNIGTLINLWDFFIYMTAKIKATYCNFCLKDSNLYT